MDNSFQGKSDFECFTSFSENPKKVSPETLKGAHKFVAKIIKDGESGPTVKSMIPIFSAFTTKEIKSYVFTCIRKSILLELLLCIIQDLILNGPERAKTLQIELVNTKAKGKTLRIVDPFTANDDGYDNDFLEKIDEAFFCLKDSEGKSPDVSLAAGQGHAAPYSPFAKDGSYVEPKTRKARRSLEASIEVCSIERPPTNCIAILKSQFPLLLQEASADASDAHLPFGSGLSTIVEDVSLPDGRIPSPR